MSDNLERRVSLRMTTDEYDRVEAQANRHMRKPAQVLRAAMELGLRVIEKEGDAAIIRALKPRES